MDAHSQRRWLKFCADIIIITHQLKVKVNFSRSEEPLTSRLVESKLVLSS